MKWALVSTITQNINIPDYSSGDCVWVSTSKPAGTICNLISYDGSSTYAIPTNCELKQVPNTANIGDEGYGS